jgi:hypothetical protein
MKGEEHILGTGQLHTSYTTKHALSLFYVLLTVRFGLIPVNNQLDAQFLSLYVYFNSLHVSSNLVLIIRRINCINATSVMCHSV